MRKQDRQARAVCLSEEIPNSNTKNGIIKSFERSNESSSVQVFWNSQSLNLMKISTRKMLQRYSIWMLAASIKSRECPSLEITILFYDRDGFYSHTLVRFNRLAFAFSACPLDLRHVSSLLRPRTLSEGQLADLGAFLTGERVKKTEARGVGITDALSRTSAMN